MPTTRVGGDNDYNPFRPAFANASGHQGIRQCLSKDAGDYPNPDLAIEVDLSPPKVAREGIYAAFNVAEFWTFNGTKLTISRLGKNGRYRAVQQSGFLPLRATDILRWIIEEDQSDYELWTQRVRAWATISLTAGKPDGDNSLS